MAKKGIKIADLARELGVTSRQLIDRCIEGGLPVQNSVTKLSIPNERQVRAWYTPPGDAVSLDAGEESARVDE